MVNTNIKTYIKVIAETKRVYWFHERRRISNIYRKFYQNILSLKHSLKIKLHAEAVHGQIFQASVQPFESVEGKWRNWGHVIMCAVKYRKERNEIYKPGLHNYFSFYLYIPIFQKEVPLNFEEECPAKVFPEFLDFSLKIFCLPEPQDVLLMFHYCLNCNFVNKTRNQSSDLFIWKHNNNN